MKAPGLNLAERPFVNERPAKRTTLLLWIVALALLGLNVFLYQRHLSGQYEQRQAIATLEQQIAEERAVAQSLAEQLDAAELAQQNLEVAFLNSQIARRTFSWSQLFDRLTEVLPETVQLRSISPRLISGDDLRRVRAGNRLGGVVMIELGGEAKSSEAVLTLLDSLFAHPSFLGPNLMSENEKEGQRHDFRMTVLYLPAKQPKDSAAAAPGDEPAGGQR